MWMDTFMPNCRHHLRLAAGTIGLLAALWAITFSSAAESPAPPSPAAIQFFETKVRPVLVDNCIKCHGNDKQKGNLRLDSLAAHLAGGDQGPVVVPKQPEKSLL